MSAAPSVSFPDYVDLEKVRLLLCAMQSALREHLLCERNSRINEDLAAVAEQTPSDTIYVIDKAVEKPLP